MKAVTDYLGHPCRFTEAKIRFSDPYEEASEKKFQEVQRNVGRLLLDLNDRISHALHASQAIRGLIQSIDDAEEPHALLELLAAYELDTANIFWGFAGLVLAGFENVDGGQAKHIEPTFMQGRA